MSQEKRQHVRTNLQVSIKVMHPVMGDILLQTGDISDGGAYFQWDQELAFEVGEEFPVQVQSIGEGDAPVVMMRVIRKDNKGLGLVFVG